jgi:hypothetical protein
MRLMHARLEERAEAHRLGLDTPTEGTMKVLVECIYEELQVMDGVGVDTTGPRADG